MSASPVKPIFLLADSRLLFWKRPDGSLFLKEVAEASGVAQPSAAYIGASNNDDLQFYDGIFAPAMQQIETRECRMLLKRPAAADAKFLESAHIILLAGGSVELGWRIFSENGMQQLIRRRFLEGAVLMGVSAGAVQLGRGGLTDDGAALLATFGFLPFYVAAHDEKTGWQSLRKILALAEAPCRGVGLPFGGGAIYRPGELEPVAKPVFELGRENDNTIESLALPPAS